MSTSIWRKGFVLANSRQRPDVDTDQYIMHWLGCFRKDNPVEEDLVRAREVLDRFAIPLQVAIEAVVLRQNNCTPARIVDAIWSIAGDSVRPRHFGSNALKKLLSAPETHAKFTIFQWDMAERKNFSDLIRHVCYAELDLQEDALLESLSMNFLAVFYDERLGTFIGDPPRKVCHSCVRVWNAAQRFDRLSWPCTGYWFQKTWCRSKYWMFLRRKWSCCCARWADPRTCWVYNSLTTR